MRAIRGLLPGLLLALALFAPTGCSDRVETAASGKDSTAVYPAKEPGGVEASILLYRAKSKKSGRLLGADGPFTIKEKSKVRARITLENADALAERGGMFHLVWVDPEGKEFYTKRIDWTPEDGDEITSSVSAYPGKRDPGEYALRLYLFRELIAEKSFLLETEEETAARKKAEKAARSKSSKKKSSKKKSGK